jgi:hypothetical protein
VLSNIFPPPLPIVCPLTTISVANGEPPPPLPAGVAYVPSALRKSVVPPAVVSVTPLTTCPAGSVTVPVNVGEARLALSPIAVA